MCKKQWLVFSEWGQGQPRFVDGSGRTVKDSASAFVLFSDALRPHPHQLSLAGDCFGVVLDWDIELA
jgi:hypothetical protein